jgi:tetratricopeptide (TPR) repeat protein
LLPLLDALEQIHAQQVYHLDLCAHNVRLAADGQPVLIDFGASRQIIGDYTHSLALVLRPGYSPLEQYADKARIGPWTDIYACGALLYVLLCGRLPPSAPERLDQDRLQWPSELGIAVHPGLEAVLRKSLALRGEDRWQSIAQLRQAFAVCAIAPAPLRAAMPPPRRAGSNIREGLSPLPRRALIAMILLLLALPAGLRWLPQAPPENVFPAPLPDTASRPLPTPPPPDTPLRASAPLEAPPAPREDSAESEPRQLLARAEAQLRERKLTTPPGDNAYETYRDLLARRPEHPAALAGLRRIAEEYLKLAREAEANKQQEWIRKGLAVWPEHPGLLALQEQIKPPAPAPEAVPDPELALYPAALAALNRGRWEQAYRLYQRILLARPGDPEARQGITQIAEAYRQAAEKDYREGKLAESLVWVAKGLAIAPENARLTALQAEIGIALEKPATEPAAPAEPKPVPSPSPPMLLTPTF